MVWKAKTWLRDEVENISDLYGQAESETEVFIKDLLQSGEYRDELTDRQVEAVLKLLKTSQD